MSVLSQQERIAGERRVREQLGLPMMGANPNGSASEDTLQIESEILGAMAYAYGEIWSRPGLSMDKKSLAMIAMMAAANRPAELRVHLKGALKNGCTPDEIREILLLVALYCGIPAANEAHRAAVEVLGEEAKNAR